MWKIALSAVASLSIFVATWATVIGDQTVKACKKLLGDDDFMGPPGAVTA